jgi:glycosyltransferase involved in cell wall biosynthesis
MRILYTHTSSLIGGGNMVLLNLLRKIDRTLIEPVSVLPEPGPLETKLQELDVPYFILDLRPRNKLDTAFALGALAIKAMRHTMDILHANDPLTYRVASRGVGPFGARLVCHVHHPDQDADSLSWALKRVPDLILTPSEFVKEQVCQWLGRPGACLIKQVGNPVDVDWFSPAADPRAVRSALELDVIGPHVTILAALAPHKGHDCFLRTAAIVARAFPSATFHVVGSAQSGNRRWYGHLRELASELGIERRVRFWGFVTDETARDILRASDLVVLPTQIEGFCLALAEAQACEVPVLASDIAPLGEVVRDGETGWLIPPGDHEQFANKAVELLSTPALHRRFGRAGRDFIVRSYGHDAFARKVTSLYAQLGRRKS